MTHCEEGQGRNCESCRQASRSALKGLWLLFKDAWFGIFCLAAAFAIVVLSN
jgi:hypothetical protein